MHCFHECFFIRLSSTNMWILEASTENSRAHVVKLPSSHVYFAKSDWSDGRLATRSYTRIEFFSIHALRCRSLRCRYLHACFGVPQFRVAPHCSAIRGLLWRILGKLWTQTPEAWPSFYRSSNHLLHFVHSGIGHSAIGLCRIKPITILGQVFNLLFFLGLVRVQSRENSPLRLVELNSGQQFSTLATWLQRTHTHAHTCAHAHACMHALTCTHIVNNCLFFTGNSEP